MSNIIVKNHYCELLNGSVAQRVLDEEFPVKVGYWTSRAIAKLRREAKFYWEKRNELVEKYKKEGSEEIEKDKDDATKADATVELTDPKAFRKDLLELQDIDIDLGINLIKVNLEELPELTLAELEFLLPFFDVQEVKRKPKRVTKGNK